jgi:steroid delta-isomerase-like uncharacterized protein
MITTLSNVATPIDIADSFFNSYDAHDVDGMLTLCSDDAHLHYVGMGKQGEGRIKQVAKTICSTLFDAFPHFRVRLECAFADEQNVAAQVTIEGTQRKDFVNIPNHGRHYDLPHAFLLKTGDRRLITSITAYWDNANFYSQLGKKSLD